MGRFVSGAGQWAQRNGIGGEQCLLVQLLQMTWMENQME